MVKAVDGTSSLSMKKEKAKVERKESNTSNVEGQKPPKR